MKIGKKDIRKAIKNYVDGYLIQEDIEINEIKGLPVEIDIELTTKEEASEKNDV